MGFALLVAWLGFALAATSASADLKLTKTVGGAQPAAGARTVPFFTSSFAYGGTAYPYTMVGTDPHAAPQTTTVPATIVPLRLVFPDGQVADVGSAVGAVTASPLFQPARFSSGTTQYGDAMRRAMFWTSVKGTGYHVLLGQPTVLPVQTLKVPAGQGAIVPAGAPLGSVGGTQIHAAATTGVVSPSWFEPALDNLLASLHADPSGLTMILSRNVIESDGVGGFHSAHNVTDSTSGTPSGQQRVRTWLWASYADPYFYAELPSIAQNIDILSHEVSEWLHDPFIGNAVPPWESPMPLAQAFYGCSSLLETGDAAADAGFVVGPYQLQDEAFLSWFARQSPSEAIGGRYDYLGLLGGVSPSC